MKSVKSDKSCEKIKYPCLMKGDSGDIYLMVNDSSGTRLYSAGRYDNVGLYSTNLNYVKTVYSGSICLEN